METNSNNQSDDRLQPTPKQRNFDDLVPLRVEYHSRHSSEKSPLTIVNTKKFGKRALLGANLFEYIGSPVRIQITINADGICISEALPDGGTPFVLRKAGKRPCVYSSQLVDTLTAIFNLSFDGRTSISFYEVDCLNKDGVRMAFVPLRQAEQQLEAEPASNEQELETKFSSKNQETDFLEASPPEGSGSADVVGPWQEAFEE